MCQNKDHHSLKEYNNINTKRKFVMSNIQLKISSHAKKQRNVIHNREKYESTETDQK